MANIDKLARFVFEWSKNNHKQIQSVVRHLREIEGETGAAFSREAMVYGDWRRYHRLQGELDIRQEVDNHLWGFSAQMKELVDGGYWLEEPPYPKLGDEPEPCELHPPSEKAENDSPADTTYDLLKKRQELDAQNQHLSEAIRQKSELVKSLTLEETELRGNISHWMIKKSALRKECQEIEIRRDAVLDGTPTEVDILDRKERLKDLESDIESAEAKVGFLTEHIKRLEISESRLTEEVRAEAIAEINDFLVRITEELPAISEFRADDMEDAVDQLCKDLPEGWIVSLHMEKGAAWVDTNDPTGSEINLDAGDDSLIDQLISALELAKKQSEVD